ncbi:phosphodiester glycosidase family protein [Kribbella sp. CA-293567]|uniref:phosphodiester glycosidase family protein n=1 Tax=Kribbella sp. CA-293567 TaxID=3002436 RepID=UPI0022DD2308|nr:phosphodiester glycosidase family protein [Kribbella sp. CA-293567]WBQ03274.1 phosphodiester glycosidase family protein [Kribbella sp. CA-293567]
MNTFPRPSRSPRTTGGKRTRTAVAAATTLAALATLTVASTSSAAAQSPTQSSDQGAGQPVAVQYAANILPLGDADLTETRTSTALAEGVTLTRIVRGTEPAPADQINTTPRGPWVVNVLTIDPRKARGELKATYGADLAKVEKTTDLVRTVGALAGVNASFFTFTASALYPGDPVGLGIFDGKLLSEPLTDPAEANFIIDAKSNKAVMGHLTWSGSVKNPKTGTTLPLEFVNHPPVIPAACATLPAQTACAEPGDVTLFTPEFAATTPAGAGIEVVLDRDGCVERVAATRGTSLTKSQTSLQATGSDSNALLGMVSHTCLKTDLAVANEYGTNLKLKKDLYAVTGRYRLTANGKIVVPAGTGSFFDRNPRTIVGTATDGKLTLATIDGRQTTSVGTTMDETAAVAKSLGLHDAINLDGGGSTAMAVNGALVSRPSGTNGAERAVGDALVYVEK